jgi:hypothetical protein
MPSVGIRVTRLFVTGLAVLGAAWICVDALRDWSASDMEAYWNAGTRLRDGGPLYIASYSVGAHDLYLYSPWFAWLWIPLTYLPRGMVTAGWQLLLSIAACAAVWPTLRRRTLPASVLAMVLGAVLLWTVAKGNVHALVVAGLVWGVPRRSGPVWIGLAASLKAAPLAFVLVYIGRRQWRRAAMALAVSAVLVSPAFLYDVGEYPRNPGISGSLWSLLGQQVWLSGAVLATLLALWLARSRLAWLGGAVAVIATFPRLLNYDAAFLLVPTGPALDERSSEGDPRRPSA